MKTCLPCLTPPIFNNLTCGIFGENFEVGCMNVGLLLQDDENGPDRDQVIDCF